MKALGYYRPEISKSLDFNKDCWRVELKVDPGKRELAKTITLDISGAAQQDPEFIRLKEHLPLKVGDPLHHGKYETVKAAITELILERGYFDAEPRRHELRVDKDLAALPTVVDSRPEDPGVPRQSAG